MYVLKRSLAVVGISGALLLMLVVGTSFGAGFLVRSSAQGACVPIWMSPSGNYPATDSLSFNVSFLPPGCVGTVVVIWTLTEVDTQSLVAHDTFPLGCGDGCSGGAGFASPGLFGLLYPGIYEFVGQYQFISSGLPGSAPSGAGFWESCFSVGGYPATCNAAILAMTMITVDPAYVLITTPGDSQIGCTSSGTPFNAIEGASVSGCSSGTETISLPYNFAGLYPISVAAVPGASDTFTINVETTTLGGSTNQESYTGTASSTPTPLYMNIGNGGSVAISSNLFPTPEFPLGTLFSIVAPLAAFSALFVVRKRATADRAKN